MQFAMIVRPLSLSPPNHLFHPSLHPANSNKKNTPNEFRWRGSLPLNLFNGEHFFRFEASKTYPGNATFTHGEDFSGLLAGMMGDGWMRRMSGVSENMKKEMITLERWNEDFKGWVEGK